MQTIINSESDFIELCRLVEDYKNNYPDTLESRCIMVIINYCLDFSTYDDIDKILSYRSSPIILSYQLIKKLCHLLNVPHLFDTFLAVYVNKLSSYLDNITYEYDDMYGICCNCGSIVMIDDDDDTFYISICDNNHKTIWTDKIVDDEDFKSMKETYSNEKCYQCYIEFRFETKCKMLKLPNHCKAMVDYNNGNIIITDKNIKEHAKNIRRYIQPTQEIPSGDSYSVSYKGEIEIITSCCKMYRCYQLSTDNIKYIKYVYSMYQNSNFSGKELEKIRLISNI